MRVRISYGIELDKVPGEAQKIGHETVANLEEALASLKKAVENITECDTDFSLIVEILNKVRLKLTDVDVTLTDVEAILQGVTDYYKKGDEDVPDRRPTMDPGGDTVDSSQE